MRNCALKKNERVRGNDSLMMKEVDGLGEEDVMRLLAKRYAPQLEDIERF